MPATVGRVDRHGFPLLGAKKTGPSVVGLASRPVGYFAGLRGISSARQACPTGARFDFPRTASRDVIPTPNGIRGVIGQFAPKIPEIVDATYEKLLNYDATARHFVPRQHGYEGVVPASTDDLSQNHEQIQFRKEHLNRYLMQLLGHSYNSKMATYLDMAGKMHTPKAGSDQINVPLLQMNALMGLLSDVVTRAIMDLNLDGEMKFRTILAFNKLLWLQNDFVNRHYQADDPVKSKRGNTPS